MNKTFKTGYEHPIKLFILSFLLLMASCSKDTAIVGGPGSETPPGGNPIEDEEFKLTLQSFGIYSRDEFIMIRPLELVETDEKELKNVKFWSGVADCSGAMAGIANKVSFIDPAVGVQVQLGLNRENILSYKVEYTTDEESDCEIAGAIIHDNIAPAALTLGSSSIKVNQASYHVPLTGIPLDAHEINVYRNGSMVKSNTLNGGVWRAGLGFLPIPTNQTTTFRFEVKDPAGNLSPLSPVLTVQHNDSVPSQPVFDGATLALQDSVITTPTISARGTLSVNTVSVLVYLNSMGAAPIATLTKAQFESGHSIPLTNGQINNLYFIARDDFGNDSPYGSLIIKANQTPSYVYSLLSTSLYADTALAANKLTRVKFTLYNSSRESVLNWPVAVTSFSASESSPNFTIDNSTGCAVDLMEASGSCEIFLNVSYPTLGVKQETIQVTINGTPVVVNLEFEVTSVELVTLSGAQKTSLGAFKMLSKNKKHLIFTNGVASIDLTSVTLNATLAQDMENATHTYMDSLIGIKGGKVQIIGSDLSTKLLTSTRSYAGGSILDVRSLEGKFAVSLNNSVASQDILLEDSGEVLNQTISSNLGEGINYLYFRSGSDLRYMGPNLSVQTVSGLTVSGDIFSHPEYVVVLGNSGSGNSLFKIVDDTIENQNLISGATSFTRLTNEVFSFQNGANFGAYNGAVAVSNATQAILSTDVVTVKSPDEGETFSTLDIKTAGGDRTVVAKIIRDEAELFVSQLSKATYGSKIAPYFDKDGDFFISNQGASSVVVSKGGELDYSNITNPRTISTPHFDKATFTLNQIVYTNLVAGKYQVNTIDIYEGVTYEATGYFLPSDIAAASPIELVSVDESSVLIYYANASSGMTFKTISIL